MIRTTRLHDASPAGPGHAPASLLGWLIVFCALAALQLAGGSPTVKAYDEGLILWGAAQVAQGALPYRDFWSMYGPGSFYLLAGLDHLFGESVLTARALDAAARAAIVLAVFALARPRAGVISAAVAAAVAFGWLVVVRDYLFPALPATACALLAVHAAARALAHEAPGPSGRTPRHARASSRWAGAGAAVGAALLFRHDFGVYAGLACLPPLLAGARGDARRRLGPFAAGAAVVVGPLAAVLLAQVPLRDLYDNLVRIPLEVYVPHRALPFPSPAEAWRAAVASRSLSSWMALGAYLPLLVAGVSVPLAVRRRLQLTRAARVGGAGPVVSEALILLNVLLCLKGSVRFEMLHMLPATMVSIVLLTRSLGAPRPRWLRRGVACAIVAGLVGTAAALLAGTSVGADPAPGRLPSALMLADWPACARAAPPRLGCFELGQDRLEVLAYLRAHARPGDRLYVGTGRHDKIFVNNVELYFFSGLPAATKWQDLHPGVQTTRAIQVRMIAEMVQSPPAFVVRNTEWDDYDEPNGSRVAHGVTLLDAYLAAHYAVRLRAGTFSVAVPLDPGLRTAATAPAHAALR